MLVKFGAKIQVIRGIPAVKRPSQMEWPDYKPTATSY
jgi:hypothetical protein